MVPRRGLLKRLAHAPNRGTRRNCHGGSLQRLRHVASDDVIAAENGASPDMRAFADDDQVADLRIAIDCAENPCFAAHTRIAHDAAVRTVHLGYILYPRIT